MFYHEQQRAMTGAFAAAVVSNEQPVCAGRRDSACIHVSHRLLLTLALFVFRVLTDDSDRAFSLDDFTFFTDRFYR